MGSKEYREKHGMTQAQLAAKLEVTQGTVSKLENDGICSDELAAKFEEISAGEVTFLELKHPKFRKAPSEG